MTFSNIVGSLNIPECVTNDPLSDNVSESIIKLIVKYRKHPRKINIGDVCKEKKTGYFFFSTVDKEKIFKDILNLDVSKSFQDTNNPTKIINENAHIFASFLKPRFNKSETNSEIPSVSKQANITPVYKK